MIPADDNSIRETPRVVRRLTRSRAWLIAAALALSGCTREAPEPSPSVATSGNQTTAALSASGDAPAYVPPVQRPADPHVTPKFVVHLFVYQLLVPYGTVSNNEKLWNRVSEDAVDVATYDLLLKNGLRVGRAPVKEWAFFKSILDRAGTAFESTEYIGAEARDVEIPFSGVIRSETLFVFDEHGAHGRTYDQCQNLMSLSFRPLPRTDGTLEATLCPLIRSTRREYQYTSLGNEQQLEYVLPEHRYDLNFTADMPTGTFLFVAPSPDAASTSRLGNRFLIQDGNAEQYEKILVLVSNPQRLQDPIRKSAKKPATEPAAEIAPASPAAPARAPQ